MTMSSERHEEAARRLRAAGMDEGAEAAERVAAQAGARRATLTDIERERIIDRRVWERLASDRAYRNAENAEEQAEREAEITRDVEAEVEQHYGRA